MRRSMQKWLTMPHNDPLSDVRNAKATARSLIDELENAIANCDLRHRAVAMRRLTDLFMTNASGFSEEHIAMFDDVMSRLIVAIDSSARAEFADVIAKHPNAPPKTSGILALDDEIEVAGSILSNSRKLDEATLVESARTKGQDHLYAISLRETIGTAVTDLLVERGDKRVVTSTVANPGAQFSEDGCTILAARSRADRDLALSFWMRTDIPRQHLLGLFAAASEEVQKQLEIADRGKVELYRYLIAQAKNKIQTKMREEFSNYDVARRRVERLHAAGQLSEANLLAFAQDGEFDEVTISMSLLCDLPIEQIERAIVEQQTDHLLVLAKAIGLSWETTRAILLMRNKNSEPSIEANCAMFAKLQAKTAVSAIQFYRLRARAEAELAGN